MKRKRLVLSVAQENARRRNWIKGQLIGMVTRLGNMIKDDRDVLGDLDITDMEEAKKVILVVLKNWKDKL